MDVREHARRLDQVPTRVENNNAVINVSKSVFRVETLDFAGFTSSSDGIRPAKNKIEAIRKKYLQEESYRISPLPLSSQLLPRLYSKFRTPSEDLMSSCAKTFKGASQESAAVLSSYSNIYSLLRRFWPTSILLS